MTTLRLQFIQELALRGLAERTQEAYIHQAACAHMNFRDPARIDRVTELLREVWHLEPGFRLTQLVMVVTDKTSDAGALWHVEDDTMEQRLRSYRDGLRHKIQSDDKAA